MRRKPPDSRSAIFDAAASEFAARGYAATGVDEIARRAGVNKAMIYYHFKSKDGLYRAILHDVFGSVADRLAQIAAAPGPAHDKIRAAVEAIASAAGARPHFPSMMAREIAEGGTHLDRQTRHVMLRVFEGLTTILVEGRESGEFRPVNPALMYFTIVAPLIFFLASVRVRALLKDELLRTARAAAVRVAMPPDDLASMLAHHQAAIAFMLQPASVHQATRRRGPGPRAG